MSYTDPASEGGVPAPGDVIRSAQADVEIVDIELFNTEIAALQTSLTAFSGQVAYIIVEESGTYATRPTGVPNGNVLWIGADSPSGAESNDPWINLSNASVPGFSATSPVLISDDLVISIAANSFDAYGTASTLVSAETTRAEAAEATKAADDTVVHLADTETITGAKTFTAATVLPLQDKGGQVFNIAAYGADPTGATDSTAAIAAARAAVLASGAASGVVYFGPGTWMFDTQYLDSDGAGNYSPVTHYEFAGVGVCILTPLNANSPLFSGPTDGAASMVEFRGGFSCMPHPDSSTGPAIYIYQMNNCTFDAISFIRNPAAHDATFYTGVDWSGSSSQGCFWNTIRTFTAWNDAYGTIPFGYAASRCLYSTNVPVGNKIERLVLQGIAAECAVDAQCSYQFRINGGAMEGCTFSSGGAVIPGGTFTIGDVYFEQHDGSVTFLPAAYSAGVNIPASHVLVRQCDFATADDAINCDVSGVNNWTILGSRGDLTWANDNGQQITNIDGPYVIGNGIVMPGILLQNASPGGTTWKIGIAATGSAFSAGDLVINNGSAYPIIIATTSPNGMFQLSSGGLRITAAPLVLASTAQTYTTGTLAINTLASGVQRVTLEANVTACTFSAPTYDGTLMALQVIQDSTGSRTMTWPANVVWPSGGSAPVLSTTAGAIDIFNFSYNSTLVKWVCTSRTI